MTFLFPQRIDQFQFIRDCQHLLRLISEENLVQTSNIKYKCVLKKQKYIYSKCKFTKCSSFLTYHFNEDKFELIKYSNEHSHSSEGTRAGFYKKIEADINQLPLTTSIATAKELICKKYKIRQACFYYLFKKIKNRKLTYLELMNLMMDKKYEVQSDPFFFGMNQLPDLLIIVTPLMKENFSLYGHWMGFDFTYNIIQDVNKAGRQWRIGIFTGISSSKKIVPFGLVVCNQQTKQRYQQILKGFSDIMNRFPEVIISDEDKALLSAIQTLRSKRQFQGVHLLDCFHILRNIKKNLIKKENWSFFNRMIRQRSTEEFGNIKNQCMMAMEEEKDIQTLRRFLFHADKYCFCFTPNSLFGMMPNTSMNEKLHDLVKSVLPYSKPFTVAVKKILIYLEELGLKCHQFELDSVKYETLFHYPPLKEIRFTVCKSIMNQVISELSRSFHHRIYEITFQKYSVKVNESKEYLVEHKDRRWECQCQYFSKTGIFCSHLAKVLMNQGTVLLDYIHPRWKLNVDQSLKIKEKYRYQRKTRRNTKK